MNLVAVLLQAPQDGAIVLLAHAKRDVIHPAAPLAAAAPGEVRRDLPAVEIENLVRLLEVGAVEEDEDALPHPEDHLVDLAARDLAPPHGLETHDVAVEGDGAIHVGHPEGDVLDHGLHPGLSSTTTKRFSCHREYHAASRTRKAGLSSSVQPPGRLKLSPEAADHADELGVLHGGQVARAGEVNAHHRPNSPRALREHDHAVG